MYSRHQNLVRAIKLGPRGERVIAFVETALGEPGKIRRRRASGDVGREKPRRRFSDNLTYNRLFRVWSTKLRGMRAARVL